MLILGWGHQANALTAPAGKSAALANGLFLVLIPDATAMRATLVAARPGQARRVLVRTLPAATMLVPSPRGRFIALAEGTQGLWLVGSDGAHLHRLLSTPYTAAPSPGCGQGAGGGAGTPQSPRIASSRPTPPRLEIDAVAWSPDGRMLAYTLGPGTQATCGADRRDGIWLTRYDQARPRHVSGLLGSGLSWSHDGRGLLTATDQGLVTIDVATGRTHALLNARGKRITDNAFSPTGEALLYMVDQSHIAEPSYTLYVADTAGHHARKVVKTTSALITSPVWAPDGRSIAYIWRRYVGALPGQGPTPEVHTTDIITGQTRRVPLPSLSLRPNGQPLIAWMHTPE